jgi:hypothetical protein
MSTLKIDDKNEIYYEYIEPKSKGFTFVFVNLPGSPGTTMLFLILLLLSCVLHPFCFLSLRIVRVPSS